VLSKRVVTVEVATVVAAVVGITTAIATFGSWFLRDLLLVIKVIILPPGGCSRTRAAVVGEVVISKVFWLGRLLFVILPFHPPKTLRPPDGSCDPLLLDVVTSCDLPARDTTSATDASGPLDHSLGLKLASSHLLRLHKLLNS
jgi:hypothetical protein